jgi:hypothetical protein
MYGENVVVTHFGLSNMIYCTSEIVYDNILLI